MATTPNRTHPRDRPQRQPRARRTASPRASIHARSVEANGLTFEVLEAGPASGDPVLLLHGFPQSAETWRPLLESLAQAGYHAVAPTQRGYSPGARPRGRQSYRIDRIVADALAIGEAVGLERPHLVGHDWGGVVGWVIAARQPDRIRTLTSLSTPHPAAFFRALLGPQAFRSVYAGLFQVPLAPEALLSWRRGAALRAGLQASGLGASWVDRYTAELDLDAMTGALNWYRAADPRTFASLGPSRVPTLFVWGRADPALGAGAARRTAHHVDGPYTFEVVEDGPHWLPEERTTLVETSIRAHLSRWPDP